jgi:hypothetical protein
MKKKEFLVKIINKGKLKLVKPSKKRVKYYSNQNYTKIAFLTHIIQCIFLYWPFFSNLNRTKVIVNENQRSHG